MSARTFVVTVTESPLRVVVEDVRTGDRRALADGLPDLGDEIARLLSQAQAADVPATDLRGEDA